MKAKATLSKYLVVYKHLQEFLNIRYHVKDIALKELTPAFISDFEMFLRTDKHCCTNTVWLYVCPLRTMVFIAINNEWLARDPFREYEIKKEETTRGFLTKEEIRRYHETPYMAPEPPHQYIVVNLQRNPIKIRNKLNNEPYNKYFLAITSLFCSINTIFAKTRGGL